MKLLVGLVQIIPVQGLWVNLQLHLHLVLILQEWRQLVQRQEVLTAASYVAAPALVHYLWMCPCTGLCYYYFIIFGCAPATTTTCEPVPAPMFQSATAGVSIPPQNPPPQENNTVITPQIPQHRCKEEEVLVVLWMLLMLLQTVASG